MVSMQVKLYDIMLQTGAYRLQNIFPLKSHLKDRWTDHMTYLLSHDPRELTEISKRPHICQVRFYLKAK